MTGNNLKWPSKTWVTFVMKYPNLEILVIPLQKDISKAEDLLNSNCAEALQLYSVRRAILCAGARRSSKVRGDSQQVYPHLNIAQTCALMGNFHPTLVSPSTRVPVSGSFAPRFEGFPHTAGFHELFVTSFLSFVHFIFSCNYFLR